nr:PfkB family carbohydrate kinase [Pseudomonadota bacterium]
LDEAFIGESREWPTGAAFIFLQDGTGENAIIVADGAARHMQPEDLEAARPAIRESGVFLTQLETSLAVAQRGLEMAKEHAVITILNPAPAAPLPDEIYPLVDYLTPNESEAAALAGHPVATLEQAGAAADILLRRGVGAVVLTLGGRGVLFKNRAGSVHLPAFRLGAVVDTTAAGDGFNGGLAVGLAEGLEPVAAVRFGCALAGIAVTRPGAVPSMPRRDEIDAVLRGQP